MDEKQVARISSALKGSADAIQGINSKFEIAETHYKKMHRIQGKLNETIEGSLDACIRLDDTVRSRAEHVHVHFDEAMEGFTQVLESMVDLLQSFDIQREVSNLPAAMVPLMVPLVILLVELAVANAYMGILIASMPEVRERYSWCSPYLLTNASCVLFGLTLSLVWLAGYRIWLSCKGSKRVMRDFLEEAEAAKPPVQDADLGTLQDVWRRIDVDCSDSMSKLEFISAISRDPVVAALVLPGVATGSLLSDEQSFDAADAAFDAISGGHPRVYYAEFVEHFRRPAQSQDVGSPELARILDDPPSKLSRSASLPSLGERRSQNRSRPLEVSGEQRPRRSARSLEVSDDPRLEEPARRPADRPAAADPAQERPRPRSWRRGRGPEGHRRVGQTRPEAHRLRGAQVAGEAPHHRQGRHPCASRAAAEATRYVAVTRSP